jgi:hypothetical protein
MPRGKFAASTQWRNDKKFPPNPKNVAIGNGSALLRWREVCEQIKGCHSAPTSRTAAINCRFRENSIDVRSEFSFGLGVICGLGDVRGEFRQLCCSCCILNDL